RTAIIFPRQGVEQIIGTHGPVALPDQLQHASAQGRQPRATALAHLLGGGKGIADTLLMVVRAMGRIRDYRIVHQAPFSNPRMTVIIYHFRSRVSANVSTISACAAVRAAAVLSGRCRHARSGYHHQAPAADSRGGSGRYRRPRGAV